MNIERGNLFAPDGNGKRTASERWRIFSAAPHRMMFFGGMTQIIATMVLWLAELIARAGGGALALTVPGAWMHTVAMLYGVFPFFIFGFLLTVYPRWLDTPPVTARRYVPAFLLLAGGALLFYAGVFLSIRWVAAALISTALGWAWSLAALYGLYMRSGKPERRHERTLNLALAFGLLGLLAALFSLAMPWVWPAARSLGLWLFLIPTIFSVAHRMIPFFSSGVLKNYNMVRPPWSLPAMFGLAAGHALLEVAGLPRWLFTVDAPLLVLVLYHTIAWGLFRSFRIRLLAMLHIAFLWLAIALALYTVQSALLFATGALFLPRAPLHALGIGFVAGLSVAMIARVTLGHSGRALIADALIWRSFVGVNAVAIVRIAAELPLGNDVQAWLNAVAAGAWIAVLWPLAASFTRLYWRPRADGRAD